MIKFKYHFERYFNVFEIILNMKISSTVSLFVITIILLTACSHVEVPDTSEVIVASDKVLMSDITRNEIPEVLEKEQNNMIKDNGIFAFNLYQEIRNQKSNLLFSPYGISTALAMIYAGARGNTAKQMADTLEFNLPQTRLHSAFNWLDIELEKRGEGAKGKDGEQFRLIVANALWGQRHYEFKQNFLDILSQNYGAGLRILDFADEPDKSRDVINEWVSEQTENKIKKILSENSINRFTRLVLTNAVYLNAAWHYPFVSYTDDFIFYLPDDSTVSVPAMSNANYFNYHKGSNYQAIELPYQGDEISMVVIMPDDGKFGEFENNVSYSKVGGIIENLEERQVFIKIPEFKFESQFSLKEILSDMGMPDAFSEYMADFSGITNKESLIIDQVIHKAFIDVDPEGTEAAAVTTIMVIPVSNDIFKKEPVKMTVDRPFIFLIRDIETGTILFLGRVLNPIE